jgi:hypothetical protein
MMGTILLIALGLAVALVFARMMIGLIKFAIVIMVAIVAVFTGLTIARSAGAGEQYLRTAFTHANGVGVLAFVALAIVVTLAFIGTRTVAVYVRTKLAPFVVAQKLRQAARRLQRIGTPVTVASLSHQAGVDRIVALAWMARQPQFMPSTPACVVVAR